uniref:HMA domain-containing protein n=1 Tax=Leersia perrieri TaxID=77586 RepID=A0A0D9XBV1_9ORYZ
MPKQKIVLKLLLDGEKKKRKAFKAAVGTNGVTSASMEGDKLIVIGEGVDAIALTTMLRRSIGNVELLTVSNGDDKMKMAGGMGMGMGFGGGGHGGGGMGMGFGGGGHGKEGKEGKEGGGKLVADHGAAPMMQYPAMPPAYQQYNPAPATYPVYPSYPGYSQQEQDPGCSIIVQNQAKVCGWLEEVIMHGQAKMIQRGGWIEVLKV